MMATRIPPKIMAKKLVRTLRPQHPDYHYLKKVFQHTRDLLAIGPGPRPKRLPDLLTEAELGALYEAIWHAQQLTSKILNFQNFGSLYFPAKLIKSLITDFWTSKLPKV